MGTHEQLLAIFTAMLVIMHAGDVQGSRKLTIVNVTGSQLWLHCKSGDDLGTHILSDQQDIYWEFHRSIWGNTVFYCWFKWVDNKGLMYNQDFPAWVDGWVVYRSVKCSQCLWNVDNSGFSIWNSATNSFYHAYNWNVSSPPVASVVIELQAT